MTFSRRRRPRAAGFTLTEMFVVIAITAVIVGVGVPAISNVIRSTERNFSENALLAGTTVAREIAIRDGVDTAAAFMRDEGGPVRISVVALAGTFEDFTQDEDPFLGGSGGSPGVERELFAAVPGAASQRLADGLGVRGWARAYSMSVTDPNDPNQAIWYDSALYGGRLATDTAKQEGHWVAPETGYIDIDSPGGAPGNSQTPRQSFMVRFQGGTGRLDVASPPALVLDPRPVLRRGADYEIELDDAGASGVSRDWFRVEEAASEFAWARRVLGAEGEAYWGSDEPNEVAQSRSRLVGLYSNDTVLCGGVGRLALYRDRELALGIGARGVNEITGTLYAPFDPELAEGAGAAPNELDLAGLGLDTVAQTRRDITLWINGDTNLSAEIAFGEDAIADENENGVDAPRARLFVVDASTGVLTGANR